MSFTWNPGCGIVGHQSALEDNAIAKHFSSDIRHELLEWMSEVCSHFSMSRKTFFLSVALLNAFLHRQDTFPRCDLQTAATSCISISSKVHDVFPTSEENLVDTDVSCASMHSLTTMELRVLAVMHWNVDLETEWDYVCTHTKQPDHMAWMGNMLAIELLNDHNPLLTSPVVFLIHCPQLTPLKYRSIAVCPPNSEWMASNVYFCHLFVPTKAPLV
jgi:hypothetical protein